MNDLLNDSLPKLLCILLLLEHKQHPVLQLANQRNLCGDLHLSIGPILAILLILDFNNVLFVLANNNLWVFLNYLLGGYQLETRVKKADFDILREVLEKHNVLLSVHNKNFRDHGFVGR